MALQTRSPVVERRALASRRTMLGPRVLLARPMFWPALALLGVYGVSFVVFAVRLSLFPFDLDQGESYDAWSGWLINLGQLPYSSNLAFPYYSSNYPPLWSYLVSIPMAWLGPGLAGARIVSSLSGLAVLAATTVTSRSRRAPL